MLGLYTAPDTPEQPRRPPWTWSLLTDTEQASLGRVVQSYVTTYNQVYACTEDDLVPPCWRRHPALATELAVQLWLFYAAHHDPKATPAVAGEFYTRHLPAFRARLDHLLGRSPGECRAGQHPDTWRKDVDEQLHRLHQRPTDTTRDHVDLAALVAADFGFRARHYHP